MSAVACCLHLDLPAALACLLGAPCLLGMSGANGSAASWYVPQPALPAATAATYPWLGLPRPDFRSECPPAWDLLAYREAGNSKNLTAFCKLARPAWRRLLPKLPPHVSPRLRKRDLLFAIITQQAMQGRPNRHANRTLTIQGARVRIFGDHNGSVPHTTPLDASLRLGAFSWGRRGLGQRALETLSRLGDARALGAARWWVVVDDDNLVFVDRLVDLLGRLPDTEPIVAGAGAGQGSVPLLASDELVAVVDPTRHNFSRANDEYDRLAGRVPGRETVPRRPVFSYNTGELLAFSDAAMPLIHRALRERRCVDAYATDTSAGACALVAGVRSVRLVSWAGLVHGQKPKHPGALWNEPFRGLLTMHHKLPDREAICIAKGLAADGDAQAAEARCAADGVPEAECAVRHERRVGREAEREAPLLPECRCERVSRLAPSAVSDERLREVRRKFGQ